MRYLVSAGSLDAYKVGGAKARTLLKLELKPNDESPDKNNRLKQQVETTS